MTLCLIESQWLCRIPCRIPYENAFRTGVRILPIACTLCSKSPEINRAVNATLCQGLSIFRDGTLRTNSWAILSAAILNNYEISREHVAAIWIIMRTHDLIYILICILMKWLPTHCNIKIFLVVVVVVVVFFLRMARDSNPVISWSWSKWTNH